MKLLFFITMLFFLSINSYAQSTKTKKQGKTISITETSVVKDTSGTIYQAEIWKKLLMTGYYYLKAVDSNDKNTAFLLIRRTEEEREAVFVKSPKPKETKSFTTGKEVKSFTAIDMKGKKYKLKDLKGKIVVLNFWFIACPPCRNEILELNKLVHNYRDSTNIIFLAFALDNRDELREFLKTTPFNYAIFNDGESIANHYAIDAYPTHVVIDQAGKAYFHTSGAGSTIIYWLNKSIEELSVKKVEEPHNNYD